MKFQYALALLAIFLLAMPVQAISLYAPERVPAFSPFTFQALLPPTESFIQASLTFDGRNVATVYPNGKCQVDSEWIAFVLKCDTFDADTKTTQGLTLVFTHTGFSKGAHAIALSSTGPQSETQTVTLNVIDAVDSSQTADLNAQVQAMSVAVATVQNENVTVQENANAAQAELGARVDTLQVELNNSKEILDRLANPPKQENAGFQLPFGQPSAPGTGFAIGSSAPIIGLGVLIVLLGAFIFIRRQKKSGFSPSGGKSSFFDGNFDAVFKNAQADSPEGAQPRKFATLGGSTTIEREVRDEVPRSSPNKIHFGDLIKDERE